MRLEGEQAVYVFEREMPVDNFLGMLTTEQFYHQLHQRLELYPTWGRPPMGDCDEAKAVKGMQAELNGSYCPMDGEEMRGEWVLCLPLRGDPYPQPVAVVRKWDNNGNTQIATPHRDLGFFMAYNLAEQT